MSDSRPPPHSTDLGAHLADLRRLRRPREGRVVAGVCGGLGRHLRIDPVVLRIVLVVMIFFGGTGLLLYAAGWLLIPNEGNEDSVIERHLGRRPDGAPDKAVMIGGIVVLLLLVASLPWWGFSWHPGVLLLLAVVGLFALFRRQGGDGARPGVGPGAGPSSSAPEGDAGFEAWLAGRQDGEVDAGTPAPAAPAPAAGPTGSAPPTEPLESTEPTEPTRPLAAEPADRERSTREVPQLGSWRAAAAPPPSFWTQPDPLGLETEPEPATLPLRPPAPPAPPARRSKLFSLTAASALIVLGILAIVDQAAPVVVPVAGYLAAPLAVIGLGLIVGAWVGRSPGLVATGVLLTIALVPATAIDYFLAHPDNFGGDITTRPTQVANVEQHYGYDAGSYTLDLRDVPFEDADVVRTSADLGLGDLTVILPPDVDVVLDGEVGAGDLELLDRGSSGPGSSSRIVDEGDDGPGGGKLKLRTEVGMGSLEVRRG